MSKQEVIRKAWGVHFENDIDENGFRISNVGSLGWDSKYFDIVEIGKFEYAIRPKSLQGIENNNGWIKIESETDLPDYNSGGYFYVLSEEGNIIMRNGANSVRNDFRFKTITHYQPITKPLKPIY